MTNLHSSPDGNAGHAEAAEACHRKLSVVIPAYNEERALPATLDAVAGSAVHYARKFGELPEIIVVDNASTDSTAEIARAKGARVVVETSPGISRARNAGARVARGRALFFLDADTIIPQDALAEIGRALQQPNCIGGAPAAHYDFKKRTLMPYMAMWSVVARVLNMSQGVGQFTTSEAFVQLGGYNEALHMAEDSDFYWRLQRLARDSGKRVIPLPHVVILPSARRMDEWPAWKTIAMTNPIITRFAPRSKWFWRGWRENTVR